MAKPYKTSKYGFLWGHQKSILWFGLEVFVRHVGLCRGRGPKGIALRPPFATAMSLDAFSNGYI
jgi:hypothetical protein